MLFPTRHALPAVGQSRGGPPGGELSVQEMEIADEHDDDDAADEHGHGDARHDDPGHGDAHHGHDANEHGHDAALHHENGEMHRRHEDHLRLRRQDGRLDAAEPVQFPGRHYVQLL